MKIAISATGPSLDVEVDPRFGRCQHFIIADPDTMQFESTPNLSAKAGGGAGISTAEMIANAGVQAVLTGNCGPNAYQVLSAAGIQVITGISGKVRDAIQGYKSGQFQATTQPNVGAHFGTGHGMGVGRGMGHMESGITPMTGHIPQAAAPGQELEALKAQSQVLAQQLSEIQRRIEELEKK